LSREGGRVWKMPETQLAEVRSWILTRVTTRDQEEEVLAAQIVSDLMKSLQVAQYYNIAQNLDLAETLCFLGYLAWAKGEGCKSPGRGCFAKVVGGNKTLTARIMLEPRTWADALTVLRTSDSSSLQTSGAASRSSFRQEGR
jgi:hypothetical protein